MADSLIFLQIVLDSLHPVLVLFIGLGASLSISIGMVNLFRGV